MQKDKLKYQELLNTEYEMFSGHNNGLITFDEYLEFNKVASAIEDIFDNKYSEDVVKEWRDTNPLENPTVLDCAYSGLPSPSSYVNEGSVEKIEQVCNEMIDHSNNSGIVVECSADLDLQMYNESI